MTEQPTDDGPLLVDPSPLLGNPGLAAALAAMDPGAIDEALRSGAVVVPRATSPDGVDQLRVFDSGDPGHPFDLYLFSSASTWVAFVPDTDDDRFALVTPRRLRAFIAQHADRLASIVFDPAGPSTVTATPADVLAALADAPSAEPPERSIQPGEHVDDLDLPLEGDWGVVDLTDASRRDDDLRAILDRQLAGAPIAPPLRSQLESRMRDTAVRAGAAGGRILAFLLQRSERAAAPLSAALYWHELGSADGDRSHLESLVDGLRGELGEGDELTGAETAAGPLVRRTRVIAGAEELGASGVALLAIDYWLEFPDGRGLAMVSFSTPQVDVRDHWLRLTDAIVLGARWLVH